MVEFTDTVLSNPNTVTQRAVTGSALQDIAAIAPNMIGGVAQAIDIAQLQGLKGDLEPDVDAERQAAASVQEGIERIGVLQERRQSIVDLDREYTPEEESDLNDLNSLIQKETAAVDQGIRTRGQRDAALRGRVAEFIARNPRLSVEARALLGSAMPASGIGASSSSAGSGGMSGNPLLEAYVEGRATVHRKAAEMGLSPQVAEEFIRNQEIADNQTNLNTMRAAANTQNVSERVDMYANGYDLTSQGGPRSSGLYRPYGNIATIMAALGAGKAFDAPIEGAQAVQLREGEEPVIPTYAMLAQTTLAELDNIYNQVSLDPVLMTPEGTQEREFLLARIDGMRQMLVGDAKSATEIWTAFRGTANIHGMAVAETMVSAVGSSLKNAERATWYAAFSTDNDGTLQASVMGFLNNMLVNAEDAERFNLQNLDASQQQAYGLAQTAFRVLRDSENPQAMALFMDRVKTFIEYSEDPELAYRTERERGGVTEGLDPVTSEAIDAIILNETRVTRQMDNGVARSAIVAAGRGDSQALNPNNIIVYAQASTEAGRSRLPQGFNSLTSVLQTQLADLAGSVFGLISNQGTFEQGSILDLLAPTLRTPLQTITGPTGMPVPIGGGELINLQAGLSPDSDLAEIVQSLSVSEEAFDGHIETMRRSYLDVARVDAQSNNPMQPFSFFDLELPEGTRLESHKLRLYTEISGQVNQLNSVLTIMMMSDPEQFKSTMRSLAARLR